MVTIVVAIAMALAPHCFKLLVAPVCLTAVFTITLHSRTLSFLRSVNLSLAAIVIAIGVSGNGSSHQAANRQQGDEGHFLNMGHLHSPPMR